MAAVFARRPAMRGTPVLVVTDGVLTCWDAPALWGGSRRELLARPGAVGALKELARHFRVVLVAQSAAHLARLACHLHSSAVQLDAAYGAGAGGALQAGGAALRAVLEGDASRRGAAVVDYDLILRDMCVRDAAAEVLFLSAVNLDFEELQGRRGADVLTDRSNAACPATCTGIPLPLPKFATKGVPSVLLVPQLRMQSFDAQALVSLLVGRRSASEGWPERLAASAPAVAPSFTAWSPADRASGRWTDGWATYAQHEVRFAALTSAVLGDRPRDAGVVTIRDDGSAGEKLRRTVLFGLRSLVKECNTSDPLTEEETSLWEQCFKYDVCGGLRRRTLQLQRPGTASRRQRIGESATLKFLDSEVKASPRGLAIVK